ncbi:hypothetical protein LMG27952_04226 [Paraburkholderia hiiakae]|uniref:DUF4148 domain-containing protein n=1 Tax=Paraburkholderia hiiakae TaxID=1081782 RepID=A0ABM8NV81_9BURK|nr:DUF4148 domain-containing protein [Paraburkholderia hiiakae]CAD6544991.1 hypothetical protein LMG27952_04226 [Paraburkholderia hiiakae]
MKVKVLASALSIAVALAAPAIAFAQSNGALTRAEVRNQLVQLEKAGYRTGDGDQTTYPQQIQQAEARVSRSAAASSDFGGVVSGTSASGQAMSGAPQADIPGLRPIYSGQ